MPDELYISSSCVINEYQVFKDREILFEESAGGRDFLVMVYKHLQLDYPRFYKMDQLSKLGWLATEILLPNGFTDLYPGEDVGIALMNRNSSLDTDIKYFDSTRSIASPALFVYTLPNIVMGEISIRHRFKGENALFVSEEFDPGFLINYVQELFREQSVQCCICGWLEAFGSLTEAVFYLVEKASNAKSIPFTHENIHKIYLLRNGEING